MCFRRSQYRDEGAQEEIQGRRLWDLFHRETEENGPPVPVAEEHEEATADADRDEVPAAH
jgi:hypothetical protein